MQKTPDLKEISPQEATDLVHVTANKVHALVIQATEYLPGRQRWLVIGRVFAAVFATHFSMSLNTAGVELKRRSEAPESEPPPSVL